MTIVSHQQIREAVARVMLSGADSSTAIAAVALTFDLQPESVREIVGPALEGVPA